MTKIKLSTLVSWGKIKDYEAKKLEELGFTSVEYENRMSDITNIDKTCKYKFASDTSRNGYTRYWLILLEPYEEIMLNYSLWQCIKKYEIEINRKD